MVYLLDTNIFRELLFHLPKRGRLFEIIWKELENSIAGGTVLSVDECYNEAEKQFSKDSDALKWLSKHKSIFLPPDNRESLIISEIFQQPKFRESIHTKNILENRPSADVYLVAKAVQLGAAIVTNELYKPQSAQLPNLCEAYSVQVVSYEDFMALLSADV